MIPQVDTVEQCKHVVSAAKYGTKQNGSRSAPPFRLIPGVTDMPMLGNDLHKSVNDQAAIMIQIETLEGINNLDAILTECPDVDIVWLGSLDCRVSMNLAANMGSTLPPLLIPSWRQLPWWKLLTDNVLLVGGDEPEWIEAEKKFEETLKKHNKPRGGFGFGPAVKQKADQGYACESMRNFMRYE